MSSKYVTYMRINAINMLTSVLCSSSLCCLVPSVSLSVLPFISLIIAKACCLTIAPAVVAPAVVTLRHKVLFGFPLV